MTRLRPDARRVDPGEAWDKIADGLERHAPEDGDAADRVRGMVKMAREYADCRRKGQDT